MARGSDKLEILIPQEKVEARVRELAAAISRDYAGETVHLIGVLKGAYIFLGDLTRALSIPSTIDFLAVSSYGKGMTTSGEVRVTKDLDESIEGKEVIIVEDIADTGLTLRYLYNLLGTRRPRSLRIAAFLSKPSRREVDIHVDYVGFEIPDRFVVGYGLDYAQKYRYLPYVAAIDGESEA